MKLKHLLVPKAGVRAFGSAFRIEDLLSETCFSFRW